MIRGHIISDPRNTLILIHIINLVAKLHSSQITGTYLKRHVCDFSKLKAAAGVRLRQVLQIFLHYVIVVKLILHSDSGKTIKLCGILHKSTTKIS